MHEPEASDSKLVETAFGMSLQDLVARVRQGGPDLLRDLPPEQAGEVAKSLFEYRRQTATAAALDRLAPAIYDLESNYGATHGGIGIPPPRNLVSIEHVRHILLYTHEVHALDPLASSLWYYAQSYAELRRLVLLQGLRTYSELLPLVNAHAVRLHAPERHDPEFYDLALRMEDDLEFKVFVDRVVRNHAPITRAEHFHLKLALARARHDPLFKAWRHWKEPDWFLLASEAEPESHDLMRLSATQKWPGTDLWFPTAAHAYFYSALQHRAIHQDLAHWSADGASLRMFLQIDIPDLEQLAGPEIVQIRLTSDVFEDWRSALSAALRYVEETGLEDERNLAGAQAELQALARQMQKAGGRSHKGLFAGAVRGFTIGSALGVGYSSLTTGDPGLLSNLLPGAAASALESGIGLARATTRRSSANSAMRNALILSEILRNAQR